MDLQDTLQLSTWLRSGASLDEVERANPIGLLDNLRFSNKAARAYRLLWIWSAPRFSGEANRRQHRYIERCGMEAFNRRIERAREWIRRLS